MSATTKQTRGADAPRTGHFFIIKLTKQASSIRVSSLRLRA